MTDLWPSLTKTTEPLDLQEELSGLETADGADSYRCTVCDSADTLQDTGTEIVCSSCGSLIDVPLEMTAEYRWFSADTTTADPSRCGFPINHLMPESSLGTMIQMRGSSSAMRRIKRYHMWNLMPYRERTLWSVFETLQVRAMNAGVSTAVLEEAKELYAQLTATAICRGTSQRDSMLAACLWEALKRHETPRVLKDIADIFNIPLKNVTRGIKQFQHVFALRTSGEMSNTYAQAVDSGADTKAKGKSKASLDPVVEETTAVITARAEKRRSIWQKTAMRTTSYEDFIEPFLKNLSASRIHGLEALVRHICAKTEELGVVPENTPPSLTASVIAFACDEMGIKMDYADIARVCGISVVTIQKCLKRLQPWKEKLLEK
jgi:transcription initiation factor TFIIIB Brf1 subunit/transcription initiation factor TFIIB